MDPRIVSLIAANQLGAIALDTSVLDAQQRNLEGGLLRRVEQFHRSDRVRLLMPDVVQRELLAHLARDATEARSGFARAVRMADRAQVLSRDALDQLRIIEPQMAAPESAAETRLAGWLARTGTEVLDVAARVDMRTLFDRYFSAQAPFAESGKKKHEFPDAAALLALEHWADEHETAVLVVSTDPDWQRFCAVHPRLVCTNSLSGALAAFQDENAQFVARQLAEALVAGTVPGLMATLIADGHTFANGIDVRLDARSAFDFKWAHLVLVDGIRWPATNGLLEEFEAVDHGNGKVVVRLKGTLLTRIMMVFTFMAGTGAGDLVFPVGNKTLELDEAIPFAVLVTLDAGVTNRVDFHDIEFLPTTHSIVLGEIEPDRDEPRDVRGWDDSFS
ncbi:PIN domain-containing protein [Burkholderia contaminans]|uniref:DUF4935 domain-containing protein n=1 Tax=Burkholderia contaminans TaxID=488447 RepID=A0A3N8RZS5_9BURK|nr:MULTISPECIES: PIN domain-containing protein [Burkholderia cepacia complex]RQT37516.1 hypothetical protein DF037_02000 [Burkholderia contaminans]